MRQTTMRHDDRIRHIFDAASEVRLHARAEADVLRDEGKPEEAAQFSLIAELMEPIMRYTKGDEPAG